MKLIRICSLVLALAVAAMAQDTAKPGTTVPMGSSIPGLSGVPGMESAGYLEIGGSRSDLTAPIPSWGDYYIRGFLVPTAKTGIDAEVTRQNRYNDSGTYYGVGLTHTFTDNVYADVHGGTSVGGFFIPKYRFDGFLNFKTLPRKQLVISAGGGYDKSKTINNAYRGQIAGTYYFEWPWIVQAGVTMTHANPGGVMAPTGYVAVTEGRDREHYITVRMETGSEAYELVGSRTAGPTSLFNFPIHNYTGTWRQWIGTNWGVNFSFERDINPYYNRNGATLGLFLDF